MKCVLLAGGRGTRISEESQLRPKPMVEIGGMPILWHIMKGYAAHGVDDFVVCLGYRGYQIKEYFANYFLHTSDVTVDLRKNAIEFHTSRAEPWRVTLVDTGESTLTGGRLLRVREHLGDEPFCMTYGDGVGDIDVSRQQAFHANHDMLVTMTVVPAPDPFGRTVIAGERIEAFAEKAGSGNLINAGFFVIDPRALDAIEGDEPWEQGPLRRLTADRQIAAWRHDGFWQCMDTLRDRELLEEHWAGGQAPWKTW
jgi:glucose-1-phosphate cytidylyltransferase